MNRTHIEHRAGRAAPRRCARGTVSSRRHDARRIPGAASTSWHGRVWKPVRPAAELARESALFSEFE
ncbi:hypothetical protein [Streptomyces sp. CAU 1734]|uniref:hypothetical protein n=1 Tax=Streptomyces sp. CAU 1734 TaxID=3140360 RepID=UPI003260C25C